MGKLKLIIFINFREIEKNEDYAPVLYHQIESADYKEY